MSLTEYAAAQLFIRAVNFLSRFQNIKLLGVNEVYHIQIQKIKEFKQKTGHAPANKIIHRTSR